MGKGVFDNGYLERVGQVVQDQVIVTGYWTL